MAWKFMMRAEPYSGAVGEELLVKDLYQLLRDARKDNPPEVVPGEQISPTMRHVRELDLANRLQVYKQRRIEDQRSWYARRGGEHQRSNDRWERWITVTLLVAAACSVAAVLGAGLGAVAGVAAAVTPSLVAWNQTRRHRELAHSYKFTSNEIGIVAAAKSPMSDAEMAQYVADCETAFSREHTMWRARRENAQA